MSRELGDAFFNVNPDTTGFAAKLAAQLKAIMAGVKGEVPITADSTKLTAAVAAAQAQIATLKAKTQDLQLDANDAALVAKIAGLQAQAARLAKAMQNMEADVDIRAAATKILAIEAQIKALQSEAAEIKIDADITAMTAKLAVAEAGLKTLGDTTASAGTRAYGPWYNLWSLIGRKTPPLFGGVLGTASILGGVGAIHLLVDVLAEVIAVVVPAGVALAAFGVAASSTVNDIIKQEQALFTITTALGTAFPGLSDGLQHFTDSVKPQVYVLFGEALNTINQHTGLFQQLATGAGYALDGLGARAENALGGDGLSGLISKGVQDLQLLGDIIGNVFGIFGNVLKTLPEYAQLLFTALRDVTGALEAITANGAIQALLGVGLAMHGAVIYGGLLVTGLLALRGPITAFGSWLVDVGLSLAVYVEAIVVAEGATATFAAILAPLAAVNPFVWVAVAIGALTALAIWLTNVKTSTQQAYDAIISQVNAATTFTSANLDLAQGLQQTNAQLQNTAKYITVTTVGMHGQVSTITELNPQYQGLIDNQKNLSGTQVTLNSRMAELVKITGSQSAALQDLNGIGVKAGAIATESNAAFASQVTQIKALVAAETQLAGFTAGPAAAAQNALTNQFLNEQLPAIQKITKAESDLLNVITGGQTSFNNFQQSIQGTTAKFVSPSGLADAATLAKGNLSGLNEQSLAFSNTLYNISIPSLQKLIGSLQDQGISTKDLSTVVATGAGQMLQYTGKNEEARAVIVALINNALGPGTVSLQTLNKWVAQNSTTLAGMNSIVAESTVKAGTLASVLNSDLNKAFQDSLFQASGAQGAIDKLTQAIINQGNQSADAKGARNQLIADLESTGLNATQAKGFVDNLQGSINAMHGKSVNVDVVGSGSGTITFAEQNIKNAQTGYLEFHAAGGVVGGTGNRDTIPAMLTPGEVVVPKGMVAAGAVDHLRGMLPGFAAGGLVGSFGITSGVGQDFMGSAMNDAAEAVEQAASEAMIADMKAKIAAAAQAVPTVATAGSAGGIIATMMRNMAAARGWTGAQWDALYAVEMAEAGFNMTATNPSSGAYGLAQFINGPSEYAAYGGDSTTATGQITAMLNYIAQRYGTPAAAWAHEQSFHWYNKGGLVSGFAAGGLAGSLTAGQSAERNAFSSVRGAVATALAHPNKWLLTNKKSVADEMATLTKRQVSEQSAYAALSGTGLTAKNLSKFATSLHSEIATSKDKRLTTAVTSQMGGMLSALDALDTIASTGKIVTTATSGTSKGTTASKPKGTTSSTTKKPPNVPNGPLPIPRSSVGPLSPSQYAADLAAVKGLSLTEIRSSPHLSHLWHLLHLQHLADLGMSAGGMVPSRTYDQGGWIYPGTTLVHNRTGQPERVVPPGGSKKLSADAQAIVDALKENTAAVTAQGSAFARGLNSTANAAATRGAYSTRR